MEWKINDFLDFLGIILPSLMALISTEPIVKTFGFIWFICLAIWIVDKG